jgi:hypothetical protein
VGTGCGRRARRRPRPLARSVDLDVRGAR